jgi:hypothetical protein
LAVDSFDEAAVRVMRADSGWSELAPWREGSTPRGDVWITGSEVPVGLWVLRRRGQELRMHFEAAKIEKVLLSWDRALGTVRLELFAHPTLLRPGELVSLRQRWQVSRV